MIASRDAGPSSPRSRTELRAAAMRCLIPTTTDHPTISEVTADPGYRERPAGHVTPTSCNLMDPVRGGRSVGYRGRVTSSGCGDRAFWAPTPSSSTSRALSSSRRRRWPFRHPHSHRWLPSSSLADECGLIAVSTLLVGGRAPARSTLAAAADQRCALATVAGANFFHRAAVPTGPRWTPPSRLGAWDWRAVPRGRNLDQAASCG